ncbi:hypothetical protein P692DRAFT_20834436 [Suillus brevipes Sb2]|nr:hypothetical protein P692DRAFT_20834436 [Suillus brevipes Sb2]
MPGRQRLSPESMPWMCFSDSGFRTGRRVVSYGLCPWAEGIMYQHFGGELSCPQSELGRRSIGT